jgi:hypothetical protein
MTLILAIRRAVLAALILLSACSAMKTPNAQSVAGVPPSGTIALNETFLAGYGGGNGKSPQ